MERKDLPDPNVIFPAPMTDLPYKGDTIIGNDVWIGQNATIMPGVKIGDGAIIGANSTVASNVDNFTIVAGNPAKPIRKRFDEELIDLLEDLKWWNLGIEEIRKLLPMLYESDLEKVKAEIRDFLNKRG